MKKRDIKISNFLPLFLTLVLFIGIVRNGYTQQVRWLRATELQSPVNEIGAEYGGEFSDGNMNFFSWPAQYGLDQNTTTSRAFWIGCRNFNDPVEGKLKSVKVIGVGTMDGPDRPNQIFEQEIKLIGRYSHPMVLVDDQPATNLDAYDLLDEVDSNLPCDRMVMVRFNTSIGVSVTKKVMVFTSSEHDNYFINDYVFRNTGIYNRAGDVQEQILSDVWFYFSPRYALAGVSCTGFGLGWGAYSSIWGSSQIIRSFGEDPNAPEFIDPLSTITPVMRGFFSWYGPSKERYSVSYNEDWGCPNEQEDGTLASAKYAGCVTLHADKSTSDPADDLYQPRTTWYFSADNPIFFDDSNQYDEVFMTSRYDAMTKGHPPADSQHYVLVDDDYPSNYPDPLHPTNPGGFEESQGFGPYTLAPGDIIHIVFAEGVSGISWEKGREVGANWLQYRNQTATPILIMPDGSATTDYNLYKRRWCETGQDSLLKTFRAAKKNYEANFNIPQPPPPPTKFAVTSDVHWIRLIWTDNADLYPHFNGYVIYRSTGNVLDWRTVYEKIFECDAADVVHQYDDTSAVRGSNYYYYIQSKDDGSQNDIDPGTPLFSSKFYTITNLPAARLIVDTGDFRSHQSGNWNDVNSWERYNGTMWEYPAPHFPTNADGVITILQGHTLTVTNTESVDQLRVATGGTMIINSNTSLQVKYGNGSGLTVNGTLVNYGYISQEGSIEFGDGGKYLHEQDGGTMPIGSWDTGSTCQFDSIKTVAPFNCNQNFYNVIWNCPEQINNINMEWDGNAIGGNIEIQNTGIAGLYMCAPAVNNSAILVIMGDIIQSAGQFSSNGTDNPGTAVTILQYGNININGGNFAISRGSQGETGTTVWDLRDGNVLLANCTTQNSNYSGAKFVFTKDSGTQTLTFSDVTFNDGGFPIEVDSTTTLDMGSSILRGSGIFNLKAGAGLQTAHEAGLDSALATSGIKTLDKAANYIFSGATAQLTGNILPDTVENLIINNPAGLTLSHTVVANKTVELKSGNLLSQNNLLMYGENGSLIYSGTDPHVTTDTEFPSSYGPNNLVLTDSASITLHASRIISGIMDLYGKLILGANSLQVASINRHTSTTRYVVTNGDGYLSLPSIGSSDVLFPVGTSTAYAPVWIRNTGTVDTLSVSVMDDITPAAYGGRVNVKWKIREETNGDGNYRLRLGWMSSLEDAVFHSDPQNNARIYRLSDTTEVGSGSYTLSLITLWRYIQRSNIITLDSFAVGMFQPASGIPVLLNEIPTRFNLLRNHPNPFNPMTTFEIQVAKPGPVQVKVFDILGREVITLLNETMKTGTYSVTWDASYMPSGIYFYRMQAGNFIDTKKMVLLK